jgi:hypothetical protein
MQYLLTEEERKNLIPIADLEKPKQALEMARKAMLKQAGFTCVHDEKEGAFMICDNCPCAPLNLEDYNLGKLLCTRTQDYSQ